MAQTPVSNGLGKFCGIHVNKQKKPILMLSLQLDGANQKHSALNHGSPACRTTRTLSSAPFPPATTTLRRRWRRTAANRTWADRTTAAITGVDHTRSELTTGPHASPTMFTPTCSLSARHVTPSAILKGKTHTTTTSSCDLVRIQTPALHWDGARNWAFSSASPCYFKFCSEKNRKCYDSDYEDWRGTKEGFHCTC